MARSTRRHFRDEPGLYGKAFLASYLIISFSLAHRPSRSSRREPQQNTIPCKLRSLVKTHLQAGFPDVSQIPAKGRDMLFSVFSVPSWCGISWPCDGKCPPEEQRRTADPPRRASPIPGVWRLGGRSLFGKKPTPPCGRAAILRSAIPQVGLGVCCGTDTESRPERPWPIRSESPTSPRFVTFEVFEVHVCTDQSLHLQFFEFATQTSQARTSLLFASF